MRFSDGRCLYRSGVALSCGFTFFGRPPARPFHASGKRLFASVKRNERKSTAIHGANSNGVSHEKHIVSSSKSAKSGETDAAEENVIC